MDKHSESIEEDEMNLIAEKSDVGSITDLSPNNSHAKLKVKVHKNSSMEYLQFLFDTSSISFSQAAIIFSGCLLYYHYGTFQYELNFIYPELTRALNLNSFTREVLTVSYFLGALIGCLLSGSISYNYMRKTPTIIATFTMSLFSLLPIAYTNLAWFIICRLLTGMSLGCALCLFLSTSVEILPTSRREFGMTIILSFNRIGVICYVIIYRLLIYEIRTTEDNNEIDSLHLWKYSVLITTINTVFLFFVILVSMKESPRFLMLNNKIEEGVRVLNEIIYLPENLNYEKLNLEAVEYRKSHANYKFFDIFSKTYLRLCLLTGTCLLVGAMSNNGNNYSLPLIVHNEHDKVWISIIFQQVLALVANIGAAFLAHTQTFGRKFTIFLGYGMFGFIALITLIANHGFIITSPIMNMFISMAITVTKIYIMEVYPTPLRVPALAFTLAISQLGDLLAPIICDLLYSWYPYAPLTLPLVNSIIGVVCSFFFSYETSQKSLDSIGDESG